MGRVPELPDYEQQPATVVNVASLDESLWGDVLIWVGTGPGPKTMHRLTMQAAIDLHGMLESRIPKDDR